MAQPPFPSEFELGVGAALVSICVSHLYASRNDRRRIQQGTIIGIGFALALLVVFELLVRMQILITNGF